MNPAVESAWIAGGSGLLGVVVGVTGTVVVARFGFRSTRDATKATTDAGLASVRAQIEADRRNRIWEKQAATYAEGVALVKERQRIQASMMQAVITGAERESPGKPVEWAGPEARLIAFCSPAVLDALKAAATAAQEYEDRVSEWYAAGEQTRLLAGSGQPSPGTGREYDAVRKALAEANWLDDVLMDTIRDELHAGPDRTPAPPVPLARPAPDRPETTP